MYMYIHVRSSCKVRAITNVEVVLFCVCITCTFVIYPDAHRTPNIMGMVAQMENLMESDTSLVQLAMVYFCHWLQ